VISGTNDAAQEAYEFFKAEFPDALPLMPTLKEDWAANPTGWLITVNCNPWHFEDKAR
jgi:kynurenine 3-monooxygenase